MRVRADGITGRPTVTVRRVISRRTFLLGGAGLVAAGGAGVAVVGPRRVGYELGLVESPDHRVPASGREVREFTLASTHMPEPVGWAICVPPTEPVGVVLCLHGRNGDHHSTFENIHLHDVVAAEGLSLAVVAVDGGPSSYWHARADGRDPESMILDELLPAVDDVLGGELPRAVIGWSMGGFGALHLATAHPGVFRAAVGSSPALWQQYGEVADGAFDDEGDFDRTDVFRRRDTLTGVTVRVDCGTDDGFLAAARAYADGLPTPNPGGFGEGFHDGAYWRSVAPAQLATIAVALATNHG